MALTEEQKETRRLARKEARLEREADARNARYAREQFWEQAYLAATPAAMTQPWSEGKPGDPGYKDWSSVSDKARIAAIFANNALAARSKALGS